MIEAFEVALGSLCGREHERTGKNCQDALRVLAGKNWLIALVTDGCGSGAHSEVGAKLGAEMIAKLIAEELCRDSAGNLENLLEGVRQRALAELAAMAALVSASVQERLAVTPSINSPA